MPSTSSNPWVILCIPIQHRSQTQSQAQAKLKLKPNLKLNLNLHKTSSSSLSSRNMGGRWQISKEKEFGE